ncbi:MAG: uncharacterized protein QOJ07_2313 [Thermoleophilaceae bacterium]|nr:uncharacterized protein [Thermoleophilaceae bacterium]
MRVAVAWVLLLLLTALGAVAAAAAGLPGPTLFGALLVGIAWSLAGRGPRLELPRPAFVAAQAAIGVELGAYLTVGTLSAVSSEWLPVTLVSLATLAVTLLAGLGLARVTDLDAPTASLGMVAGGASGIVAIADELGADDRLVAVMQYLRLLVIVLLTPVLAQVAFGASGSGAGGGSVPFLTGDGLLLAVGVGAAGTALAVLVRLPAGALLGPMLLAGALTLAGLTGHAVVPDVVRQLAFVGIGLQVGLRFTPESLRQARDVLPRVLASIFALLVACAGLGWLLAQLAGVSFFDGYLATTPGGLYAVLGVALASGANTTFVLAVQALRLFVMVLAAPAIIRRMGRVRT